MGIKRKKIMAKGGITGWLPQHRESFLSEPIERSSEQKEETEQLHGYLPNIYIKKEKKRQLDRHNLMRVATWSLESRGQAQLTKIMQYSSLPLEPPTLFRGLHM